MSQQKVWFITGASRGIGAEIAKAALEAGDNVVATGRNRDQIAAAFKHYGDRVLAVELPARGDSSKIDEHGEAAVSHALHIEWHFPGHVCLQARIFHHLRVDLVAMSA